MCVAAGTPEIRELPQVCWEWILQGIVTELEGVEICEPVKLSWESPQPVVGGAQGPQRAGIQVQICGQRVEQVAWHLGKSWAKLCLGGDEGIHDISTR